MNGDYKQAVSMGEQAEPFMFAAKHLTHLSEYRFYMTLALSQYITKQGLSSKKKWLKAMNTHITCMADWAITSPENFEHKVMLMRAEWHRLKDHKEKASGLYDKSIVSAYRQGFMRNVAIANELAACFYMALGLKKIAKTYMTDAFVQYRRWGAIIKIERLVKQYPKMLKAFSSQGIKSTEDHNHEAADKPVGENVTHTTETSETVDLASIMKATKSVSQGTDVQHIMRELMFAIAEQTQVDKAVFIIARSDKLYTEVIVQGNDLTFHSVEIKDCTEVPRSLVFYVSRMQETIALDDAVAYGDFREDNYIRHFRPRSVLCLPLFVQESLSGMLYLESYSTTGLFHHKNVDFIKVMASQAIFVKKLLNSHQEVYNNQSFDHQSVADGPVDDPMLLEDMTDRELDILNLMAAGQSNQEIAKDLGLQVSTVKVHNRNIYSKLNVHRRMKAVEQAKALQLIQ